MSNKLFSDNQSKRLDAAQLVCELFSLLSENETVNEAFLAHPATRERSAKKQEEL